MTNTLACGLESILESWAIHFIAFGLCTRSRQYTRHSCGQPANLVKIDEYGRIIALQFL